MRKIIFDTEVILDAFITNRPDSERVMTLIEKCSGFSEENMLGMVTSTTLQDVYNFCSIAYSPEVAYEGIRHLTNLITIVPVSAEECVKAFESDEENFADGIVRAAAEVNGADFILTRNTNAFRTSTVRAVTPDEFMKIVGISASDSE
jgi:predicted nucleic acid-binding protein